MRHSRFVLSLLSATLLLTVPGYAAPLTALDRIDGSVSTREPVALPADATLTVELLDVSKADAQAGRLARLSLPGGGRQLPLPFELPYYRADVQPGHRYSVRATLTSSGGALLYTTTRHVAVLTKGEGKQVQLELQQVQTQPQPRAAAMLENTYWKLTAIGALPVQVQANEREAYLLLLDGRVSGSSGCNKLMGTYTQQAPNGLRIGPLASTRMACLPALVDQETALTAALARATGYRIDGKALDLMAGDAVLARFEARYF
ncbi:YbaY family lipoprotein [Thiobacillus sp.]|uniref:YbaY family lipoprotein n=1 Tax=Thiobacillus sp. TaxID=924 RepID=UPI00286E2408|nr:YbaY family lipoprotein [Thiobacillus sp.]